MTLLRTCNLWNFICLDSLLILFAAMSKYDDCRRVDNRYTTAIGMSVWRFFNIGKYKNQKVKDVCYFNPFYVAWCLESWQGFSLTSYERFNYMKGLERQLEKDPEDQELVQFLHRSGIVKTLRSITFPYF